jgi:hypothetical protein
MKGILKGRLAFCRYWTVQNSVMPPEAKRITTFFLSVEKNHIVPAPAQASQDLEAAPKPVTKDEAGKVRSPVAESRRTTKRRI